MYRLLLAGGDEQRAARGLPDPWRGRRRLLRRCRFVQTHFAPPGPYNTTTDDAANALRHALPGSDVASTRASGQPSLAARSWRTALSLI
jgi:hypothetical protein